VIAIRPATREDVPLLFSLIVELATYERAADQVVGDETLLARWLFGPSPPAEALIAERDRRPVGFALFFATFSTWECRPGIWLEDLYVRPQERRSGVGERLLAHLAALTLERGGARLDWAALRWNEPALSFYAKLGAEPLEEWKTLRLHGDALRAVAGRAAAGGR
jgi:GNAT superfamily N-acetyltransferase